jgi:hypothetical protein
MKRNLQCYTEQRAECTAMALAGVSHRSVVKFDDDEDYFEKNTGKDGNLTLFIKGGDKGKYIAK